MSVVADSQVEADVLAAAEGDSLAWDRLVSRYAGLIWSVARAYQLSTADAADVCQTTWLRLAEHLHRLRDPRCVGAWLATTARRESLRTLRNAHRTIPVDTHIDLVDQQQRAEDRVEERERNAKLWRAFQSLSGPCQKLLRMLMADPAPSYAEVSAALEMPVGSIGPTRARCLARLGTYAGLVDGMRSSTKEVPV